MTAIHSGLSEAVEAALVKRAKYAYPLEICGFIVNGPLEQFVYEVPNVAADRRHAFQMHPGYQLLALSEPGIVEAMWHSHPVGPDGPSETDIKFKPPGMRCFVVTSNGVFEYGTEQP